MKSDNRVDLSGITFGDVFAGYLVQDYDSGVLADIAGLTYGANLTWNVTRLTTGNLLVFRRVEETTQGLASGVVKTGANVSVDHELQRNLIVTLGGSFSAEKFKGATREDDYRILVASATYMLNRHFHLEFDYKYLNRNSNEDGGDLASNIISLRLVSQF